MKGDKYKKHHGGIYFVKVSFWGMLGKQPTEMVMLNHNSSIHPFFFEKLLDIYLNINQKHIKLKLNFTYFLNS